MKMKPRQSARTRSFMVTVVLSVVCSTRFHRSRISAMPYWKEVHAEAWRRMRESGFLEWKRLSASVGIPFVSGLVQWRTGVALPTNLLVSIGSGLIVYSVLAVVERYHHVRQIVVQRDIASQKAIAERDEAIAKLTASPPSLFASTILQLDPIPPSYGGALSVLRVSALLEIRGLRGAAPNTMHSFHLHVLDEGQILKTD